MANTYFQFKQFRIDQQGCALKVCTDACLQGAQAVLWLKRHHSGKDLEILDIGTGTGLLALMLRQEFQEARVDAIEIDQSSYLQAKENFAASPWSDTMRIYHGDIRTFRADGTYDFIISNPPFFDKDLKGDEARKNRAKHTVSLTYEELLNVISVLLSQDGTFCIMLPPRQYGSFQSLAEERGFYPLNLLKVRHTPGHPVFRVISCFGRTRAPLKEEEICIYDHLSEYTESFTNLLKAYYLHFP